MVRIRTVVLGVCIVFFSTLSIIFPASTNAQIGIKSAVTAIEMRENLRERSIYQNIYHNDIMNVLEKACSVESMQQAKDIERALRVHLTERFASQTVAQQLNISYTLYQHIDRVDFEQLASLEIYEYCVLKYVFNSAKDQLRRSHIAHLQQTDIIKDFEGVDHNTIHGFDVKIETIETYIAAHANIVQRLGHTLNTTVKNPEFFLKLNGQQQTLADGLKRLMDTQIAVALVSLKERGVIAQHDISMVADKIVLEFVQDCNQFHGRYDIKRTMDSAGNILDTETTEVMFMVNVCPNYFMLQEFPDIFKSIVIHEMAHHYYFYYDDDTDGFESICRLDDTTRNNRCGFSDFVTDYAASIAEEDYAEHFMYRFMNKPVNETLIIREKFQHFENRLGNR